MEAVVEGMGFSPIQFKLMKRLQDGKLHSIQELGLLIDEDGFYERSALAKHFTEIRKILRKRGQTVVGHLGGYQWMRNISSAE